MRRPHDEFDPDSEEEMADGLEGGCGHLDERRWRRLLKVPHPESPDLVVVCGSLEDCEKINGARYDERLGAIRGRFEAAASGLKRWRTALEQMSRRLARDEKLLKQHLDVPGDRRSLGIGGGLFVAAAISLSAAALYLSINTVALAAYTATAVDSMKAAFWPR